MHKGEESPSSGICFLLDDLTARPPGDADAPGLACVGFWGFGGLGSLGFGVFRVLGLGFRVWGLGFGVFRV